MNVLKAIIITDEMGCDLILFEIDLHSPEWPYTENARLECKAAKGFGSEWVKNNFKNCEIEIIEV